MGSSTDAAEEDEFLRARRDAMLASASRNGRMLAMLLAAISVLAVVLTRPSVTLALNVPARSMLFALGGMAAALVHSTLAFRLGGPRSRWFQVGVLLDALAIIGGSLWMVRLSGSALSVLWLWPAAYLAANVEAGYRPLFLTATLGSTTALALAFSLQLHDQGAASLVLLVGASLSVPFWIASRAAEAQGRSAFQKARLERRLATAEGELEKTGFARDLHDGLGAELTGLLWSVRAANADAPPDLERVSSNVEAALSELRELVVTLESPDVNWSDACEHARSRLARLCDNGDVALQWSVSADDPTRLLRGRTRMHLVRFLLEAARNALRHTDTKSLSVELALHGEVVVASVHDEGRGHPDLVPPPSLVARARAAGATLDVASGGDGTRASLWLPL